MIYLLTSQITKSPYFKAAEVRNSAYFTIDGISPWLTGRRAKAPT